MCQLVVEPPRILQRLIQKNKNEKHLEPQTIQVRFGPKDPFGAKNINIFWDIHKRNPRFSLVFRHVH
jgi:hypothetical protein